MMGLQVEQRQHIRFQILKKATLSVGGLQPIACEIQDYCLGGLFLRLAVPERDTRLLQSASGTPVEIVFTPHESIDARTFHIPIQIKRLTASGVGVAFVKQPVEALLALQKLRMESHKSRLAANLAGDQNQELRNVCKKLLEDALYQSQDRFSQLIEEKLTVEAGHATSFVEHNALLVAAPKFRRHQHTIREKFILTVMSGFLPGKAGHAYAGGAPQELSLVGEQDFEDWLSATTEGNKLEYLFRIQLSAIEPGLHQLFGLPQDNSDNPFWPTTICNACRTALADVPLDTRVKLVAYGTLCETLSEQLEPLYAKLRELLSQGDQKQEAVRPFASPCHSPDAAESGVQPELRDLDAQGPSQQGTAPASRSPGAFGRMAGALMDLFKRTGTEQGAGSAPHYAGSAVQPGPGSSAQPHFGNGFNTLTPATPAAATGYIQAGAGGPAVGRAGAADHGSNNVLGRLATHDALPKSSDPDVQRSVNLFGMLFDSVYAEKSLSEGIKPYFERLEPSLVKLAVSDPEFLTSQNHPAHRVLNMIDRLTLAVADDGKINDERLLKLINYWTERIKNEAESNPEIYEEARQRLEKTVKPLLKERIGRISRLQEVCEGRQRADQAKLRIRRELDDKIGGQIVAKAVVDLVICGWRNYLYKMELRGGREGQECRKSWEVLDNLLQWTSPGPAAVPEPLQVQQHLHFIDMNLGQFCIDKTEQDRVMDQLADSLMVPGAAKRIGYNRVARQTPTTEAEIKLHDAGALAMQQIRVGDWFNFASSPVPLNLVWIGDKSAIYVFANYSGIRKLEHKHDEFLRMLQSGAVERTEDLEIPLIDRSYSSMIQQMHRKLAWQATRDPVTGLPNRGEFLRGIRRYWLRMDAESHGLAIGVLEFSPASLSSSPPDIGKPNQSIRDWALLLQEKLGKTALLARTSSRTFAFLTSTADSESALVLSRQLIDDINLLSSSGADTGTVVHGGLVWSADCLDPGALYENSVAACAKARQAGPNQVVLCGEEIEASANRKSLTKWAGEFGGILGQNRLSLTCQAISSISDPLLTPSHYEILLRSNNLAGDRLNIAGFISAAERMKRMPEIDRWVITQVFDWIRAFPAIFERIEGFSINLSGQSVNSGAFLEFLLEELAAGDIPGNKIIFEITETAAIDSFSLAQHFIRQIRRFGCKFSLDDFGVGFCSYTYLKNLKVDYLKIDGSFVRDSVSSVIDASLVASMQETCSFLGIKTIAEYVESEEILAKLHGIGVDYAQGFHIGKPIPIAELIQSTENLLAKSA
jgi:EAL domain-containing protein (putative c-di-GMP-specific phosphodiesterase class I)/GGDEF domain-containing protein